MPLEKTIVAAIMRAAADAGWYVTKLHGGPMQKAGLPDLLCLRHGRAVFLEVKRPGGSATKLQVRRMAEIYDKGGAPSAVVSSAGEALEVLSEPGLGIRSRIVPCEQAVDQDAVAALGSRSRQMSGRS
jgi:hypothetical protein